MKRLLVIGVGIFAQAPALFGQAGSSGCGTLSAGNDTVLCAGTSVQLSATSSFDTYSWTPAAGLSNPTTANPVAAPAVTTTYTVSALAVGPNLVVNGNFSQGDTGFSTDYDYSPYSSPCYYSVGVDFFNYYLGTNVDHTSTTDGIFLSIDGCTNVSTLWEQTVSVDPNTTYDFSFWASKAAGNQPIFEFSAIGNATGPDILAVIPGLFVPLGGPFEWDQYSGLWNSGTSTSVTIRVRNLSVEGYGVDFGMDDFEFRKFCQLTASVTVAVNPVLDLGADEFLCAGETAQLTATPGFSNYMWNTGSTANAISVNQAGDYWVTATDPCGNLQSDTLHVDAQQSVVDLGDNDTICAGESITLNTVPNSEFVQFSWTGNSLDCYSCASPVASPASAVLYILTATSAAGCSSTDSLLITVNPFIALDLGPDATLCAGQTQQLAVAGAFTNYLWSTGSTNQSITTAQTGDYWVQATDECGNLRFDTIHLLFSQPLLELDEVDSICPGESIVLHGDPGNQFSQFSWTGNSLSCYSCEDPVASPNSSSLYVLTATSALGCSDSDSTSIVVKTVPDGIFTTLTDGTCSEGGTITIETANTNQQLLTSLDFGGFSSETFFTGVEPGSHLVLVKDGEDGCPLKLVVSMEGQIGQVYIPNAFTPDGNEYNNYWMISGNCLDDLECRIFNRWGEQVTVLSGINEGWDGTFNGEPAPESIYTYVVNISYPNGETEMLTGTIALLR